MYKIFPMQSLTEENYLKAIYKLLENGESVVTTNAIAFKIRTRAASVTDMLKKLSNKKLIHYQKYQGVSLTGKGKKIALGIIRKHRLWEHFLVDKLYFKWDEVHEIAEQLEHIHSEELINRIDKLLGYPKFDPHGDPIPDMHGKFAKRQSFLLTEMRSNSNCIMTGVVDHSPAFLHYLDEAGINLGDQLFIKQINEYDKSMVLTINRKKNFPISHEAGKNILVKKK